MNNKKALLGYDIGTSSIKAALIDADTGELIASAFSPEVEMKINSPHADWAEQHPDTWWRHVVVSTKKLLLDGFATGYEIVGIGSRFIAGLIDSLIIFIVLGFVSLILFVISNKYYCFL